MSALCLSPCAQVEKAHPGVGAASEGRREDSSERQAVPCSGVCPRGAQEAHHVLHWRSRPPWPATSSHRLWAYPTIYQVTNLITVLASAVLLLALPLARACPFLSTPWSPLSRPTAGHAVFSGGLRCLDVYHRDERLTSLCYVKVMKKPCVWGAGTRGYLIPRWPLTPHLWLTTLEGGGIAMRLQVVQPHRCKIADVNEVECVYACDWGVLKPYRSTVPGHLFSGSVWMLVSAQWFTPMLQQLLCWMK